MTVDEENERTASFLSIIKESGIDWAIRISDQLEKGDDLKIPNSYRSPNPISNFQEVIFNAKKCKSKHSKKLISHDGNYYKQPLSGIDIQSPDNVISDNDLVQFHEDEIDNKNIRLFPS